MRRREFISLLGGTAATWPLTVEAQQREPVRRIAMLMNLAADDPESVQRMLAFGQGLQRLGWSESRNLQVDIRWAGGDADRARRYAIELVSRAPDIIVAAGAFTLSPLLQATRSVPIVFVQVTDPVGAGFVQSLARPGGNATGFTQFEFAISAKWLELLKQIAPKVTRVAVVRDVMIPAGIGQFSAIQSVAPSLGVELTPIGLRDASEIERGFARFARGSDEGVVVTTSTAAAVHRELILKLATQLRLPAIYPYRYFAAAGGLISYGHDHVDQYRQAAGYVDRILKGEKPADLPVQAPTKYETVLNMKTAKALGLEIPTAVFARADEVIE